MSLFLPIDKCDYCHQTVSSKDLAMILIRDKLTRKIERRIKLCPTCRVKFYNHEIKDLDIRIDDKINLSKWNKKESEIWTPESSARIHTIKPIST